MTLVNTLMNLKDESLVDRFELVSEERARVWLPSGKTFIVYMAKDYIVGETAVKDALVTEPHADLIIYNQWDRPTSQAVSTAKELHVPFIHFSEFKQRIKSGQI